MNIKQATQQIEGAIEAYLLKDGRGLYKIPTHMQRPIIMLGPPGVGKTAVVEQIADRMGLNFVSYSITHHTRQSALGLPFIEHESFGGRSYSVSEYTMSEIIAAVYHAMESSGVSEGILFLDEVNCVSETLAPAMLQFLQYKTFGQHKLPEGWVIVTAGNPPEYNRAAREFDPAMMDRLKKIDVEADLKVWLEYAQTRGLHPAVLTYLDSKPGNFYSVHADVRGTRIVTARGWEDLSRMLEAYEAIGYSVDSELVGQYLQDAAIAEDFALYYELFCRYSDDYKVREIMAGQAEGTVVERARAAAFDERVALVGLLVDAIGGDVRDAMVREEALRATRDDVLGMKAALENGADSDGSPVDVVEARIAELRMMPDVRKRDAGAAVDKTQVKAERLAIMGKLRDAVVASQAAGAADTAAAPSTFDAVKAAFNKECAAHVEVAKTCALQLDNILDFLVQIFGEGQETLIFVTKLAVDPVFMKFAGQHASEKYLERNKSLLFHERSLDLLHEAERLQGL